MDSQKQQSASEKFEELINIVYEPKRENRFLVRLPEELNISEWRINKSDLPKFINCEWAEITMEFTDLVGYSVSEILLNFIKGDNKEIVFSIECLDPTGWVAETWVIKSKAISVDFGTVDYSSDKILKPKLTVKPELCELIPGLPRPEHITS
jgi:hypothetical protein